MEPSAPRRSNFRLPLHPYALPLLLILLIVIIQQAFKTDPGNGAHLSVGRSLVAGADIYPQGTPYVYPPFTAFLMVPFAFVPLRVAQFIWCIISSVALAILVQSAWKLSGGGALERWDQKSHANHWMLLLGCLCALRFAFNALQHLSLDLLIVMLLLLGGRAALRQRFVWTAICWGLATAFKGPPLLFAGYLIWRGKWRAAGLMILVALAVNLLPDLVARPAEGGVWLTRWYHRFIEPLASANTPPGKWNATITDNQSIAGAVNRWFLTTLLPSPDPDAGLIVSDRANTTSIQTLKRIVYTVDFALCLAVALIMRPGRWPRAANPSAPAPSNTALEIGVVFLLILLLSPMTSRSLFCTMLLPAFCLARAAIAGKDKVAWWCLVVAITGSVLSFNTPLVRNFNREMLWMGIITLSALALLVGSLWLLQRQRTTAPASRSVPLLP